MNTAQVRQKFLDFFASKGHAVVESSSLVPPSEDKTLLFTNAGMNQFKDVFLGFDKRPYACATTSQKCVRAGGKHNDLENVGYTARHHTFFEMLGNFSFGDYFKRDAIHFAWEFLTSAQWLALPQEKLLATVYADDDEAYAIWRDEIGLPENKIIRIGDNKGAKYASDNFWQMGDTGPCGPCSEIFYDHGEEIWGGPPGSAEEDGDRFIEIWNCVFMQFNRDEQGQMHSLPKPSVDTGMGLERISAVMQKVHSNYEIDLFQNLIKSVKREEKNPENQADGVTLSVSNQDEASRKVIADHIRSCSFLIADGVMPGNDGRGYVLRRIIRRAVRHGYKLGMVKPFFHKLVQDLVQEMGGAYPELINKQVHITHVLKDEETRFAQTLTTGMSLFEKAVEQGGKTLDGSVIFKLYDTYGFPYDLTADICRERKIEMDEAGFEREMDAQRARARAAGQFKADVQLDYQGVDTQFIGYDERAVISKIVALYQDGKAVQQLGEGDQGVIVLDKTPFYAESGGQVGDCGIIKNSAAKFEVSDTQKIKAAVFGHWGVISTGSLCVGDCVEAEIDSTIRDASMRNHSATHLMHAALRQVLGTHVEQKGSLVTSERTRFDISHPSPISADEIRQIELWVNRAILANVTVRADVMSMEEAQKTGAMMLFGEKYGDSVRVLQMGDFSTELCGGTHVARTGDIGMFKIIAEQGIAAGVRRIEAVTGLGALHEVQNNAALISDALAHLKAQTSHDLLTKIDALNEHNRMLEKSLIQAKTQLAQLSAASLLNEASDIGAIRVLVRAIDDLSALELRDIAVSLVGKGENIAVLLASVQNGKVSLCSAVSKALSGRVKAGDWVRVAAESIGGKGGGKPELAQAGGTDIERLPAALQNARQWIEQSAN